MIYYNEWLNYSGHVVIYFSFLSKHQSTNLRCDGLVADNVGIISLTLLVGGVKLHIFVRYEVFKTQIHLGDSFTKNINSKMIKH